MSSSKLMAFELLDRMAMMVSNAKTIPLYNRIMLEKEEFSSLMRRLEESIPTDLQKAKAIIEQEETILSESNRIAEETTQKANQEAQTNLDNARNQAQTMVTDAQNQANETIRSATDQANAMLADAQARANALVADAQARAQQMVSESEIIARAQVNGCRIAISIINGIVAAESFKRRAAEFTATVVVVFAERNAVIHTARVAPINDDI